MRSLEFDEAAFEDLAWWIKQDRSKALRIVDLIKDVRRNPFQGNWKAGALEASIEGLLVAKNRSRTSADLPGN